ncbi:GIY-YIG nuclease family protein [Shouchella lonarensis]|uniref:GIY-YIG domain-containing protein n=1 Tax=Shouchella lonarensis TaxID=1464122 RepID=A0A1G6GJ45_9BACI|nr:GIY-YIG nuclease family protein [Shouchella lonarensis]SDB81853.1 protein of unknown function [Shouchella lonarensis]
MTNFRKIIRLYHMDGSVDGRWMCDLSNWTGKAYKIPRTCLKKCDERDDLRTPGIYFLFGIDEETNRQSVYVGESEDVYTRLTHHFKDKDEGYWTETIAFVSKDDHLNKAHIKYLEHQLYSIMKEAQRYTVRNGSVPRKSVVSEIEQAELEEFMSNVKLLVSTLGHRAFDPLREKEGSTSNSTFHFIRSQGKGGKAEGQMTNEGFVVMKGSYISPTVADYVPKGTKEARKKHAAIIDENSILQEDALFSSPSSASSFVCGKNSNGWVDWKTAEGKTLREVEDSKLT